MHNTNVLISGASVAGPALAYWLGRYGFQPTVVEEAPALRGGGYAVDFRGPAHLQVLERMGVLEELRRLQTGGSPLRFVDETGRQLLYLPGEFAGGEGVEDGFEVVGELLVQQRTHQHVVRRVPDPGGRYRDGEPAQELLVHRLVHDYGAQ